MEDYKAMDYRSKISSIEKKIQDKTGLRACFCQRQVPIFKWEIGFMLNGSFNKKHSRMVDYRFLQDGKEEEIVEIAEKIAERIINDYESERGVSWMSGKKIKILKNKE